MEERKKSKSAQRWFILLGAHVSMLVYGATYRSFGVFLVEWRRYFDSSVAEISIIMSVLSASVCSSGFFAGPLITRWGCHNTLLLGAFLSITGTIASVFADSPGLLCFTAGFLPGFGVGLIKVAAQVVVAFHFKKGYSRANGFVSAGVALGIMTVPPLLQLCINQYGWRGALLISAGIQAQVIPSALVARPRRKKKSGRSVEARHGKQDLEKEGGATEMEPLNQVSLEVQNKSSCGNEHKGNISEKGSQNADIGVEASDENQGNTLDNGIQVGSKATADVTRTCKDSDPVAIETQESTSLEKNTELFSVKSNDNPNSNLAKSDEAATDDIDNVEEEKRTSDTEEVSRCRRFFRSSGWPLFRESIGFTLFQMCQVAIGVCYTAIMTHFIASAVYSGIDEQAASFLLSALGIGSLIARLGNGWVIDLKVISPEHLYVVAMVVLGVSTIVSRASQVYGWYMFIAFLFGASTGLLKCLVPVVLKKFVGVENLGPGMGIFTIFTGVGDFIGPIFAGALYDAKETYDLPFYVAGSLLTVSSCILLLERPLRRCRDSYQGLKSTDTEPQVEGLA